MFDRTPSIVPCSKAGIVKSGESPDGADGLRGGNLGRPVTGHDLSEVLGFQEVGVLRTDCDGIGAPVVEKASDFKGFCPRRQSGPNATFGDESGVPGLAVPGGPAYIPPDTGRAFARAFAVISSSGDGPEGASSKARNPSAKR